MEQTAFMGSFDCASTRPRRAAIRADEIEMGVNTGEQPNSAGPK
jgi:hypothetical protein